MIRSVLFILLLLVPAGALAHGVFLKNGKVLQGRVEDMPSAYITFGINFY
jgi:hypothetical protein